MSDTALEYLLASYFHQDLYDLYGDEWGALDQFIARDPHRLHSLPSEIAQLLAEHPSEEELKLVAASAGCEFKPGPEDGGYRGWLTEIARRVESSLRADP